MMGWLKRQWASATRPFLWLGSQLAELRPQSLASMARSEKARLATEPRSLRVRQQARSLASEVGRDEFSFIWLALLAFSLLFQPWVPGFSVFSKRDPTDFLEVLWQVQGAALALSLAVVLFVFQSVYGNRLGGSLRDFAEETWLFPVFYAGLLGLVLDGVVLLHGGRDAPGGWAATWAVIWAAATAVSLLFLFVFTIRAIDPRALHQLRLRRTSRAIEAEIEDVIFRRVAFLLLHQFCESNGIEFDSFFRRRPSQDAVAVRAHRQGEVRNIRLRPLRKLAADAAKHDFVKPTLCAEIGSPVRSGTELAWLGAPQKEASKKLARAFRVRNREQQRFRTTVDDLHDEALQAIRTPSPVTYSAIAELYEEMLLALPETWARYGQQYTAGIAGGAHPFELTVQDILERNLYEEMTQAARSTSRDIAHDALDFPIVVAQRALDLDALALSSRMINLWVAARRSMLPEADRDDTGLCSTGAGFGCRSTPFVPRC
jgi:hypothetical protein